MIIMKMNMCDGCCCIYSGYVMDDDDGDDV
jgi:hypothetical protein